MTTRLTSDPENSEVSAESLARLNANLEKIEALTQRFIQAVAQKKPHDPGVEAPSVELFGKAATAFWQEAMNDPGKIIEKQVAYWGQSLKHYVDAQHLLAQGKLEPPADPTPADRRFRNPLWSTHPYFNFLKQQYLINVQALDASIASLEMAEPQDRRRIEFFARQIVDMMSPTNFLATNPDALERAVETEGESLVRGLENLVRDIELNRGDLLVTLADREAFKVGSNIGTSEGSVVFRNRMFELIQYKPSTEKVHERPLVIFPPWINKYYILDLKPENSLIKWIVDQGYTVFVASWKNPDATYADVSIDTYVEEGYLKAIEEVKAITGQKSVNAVGYCIGGTTLSLTLALMQRRGDKSVKAATLFTTLTDFEEPGDVSVFLNDDFVDGIEQEVSKSGYLDKYFMGRTFTYLRANDLVYGPAIKSYMMGEAPPAFDLLYWNGDGTNLPAAMTVQYLRGLCQSNLFAKGEFALCGEVLSLADIRTPVCAIACETDHIAPWKSCFAGVGQFGSTDKTFILAESGHIAGVVSPPGRDKYGHYTGPEPKGAPEAWKDAGTYAKGSWWPAWEAWLASRSGKMIPARKPGDNGRKPLGQAPGTYVAEIPSV